MSKRYISNRNTDRLVRQEKQQEDRRRIERLLGLPPNSLTARGVERLLTRAESLEAKGLI